MKRLFEPVDPSSLVFFRILFGVLAFADVAGIWGYYHLYKGHFNAEKFLFNYIGFEWLEALPEPFMSAVFLLVMAAAVCIALGKWYRTSCLVFALGFNYFFLLEKSHYLNHGYLFCWLSWIMIFLPANRDFSLDVAARPKLRLRAIPAWTAVMLPLLMGIVYFYGGLAKLNADWLQGAPMIQWMDAKGKYPIIGPILKVDFTAYFMAYAGAFFDLSVAFLLLFRRTRGLGLAMALFFHLANTLVFQIGIFPWLSLGLTLMFFPPDTPKRWIRRLGARWKWLGRRQIAWENRTAGIFSDQTPWQGHLSNRPLILGVLALVVGFHLLFPFRHYLFEGPVGWTEEGHRYSWRMMLRSKIGSGHFWVEDPATGEKTKVVARDYLNSNQTRKLYTHPDMIWQFAQFLEKEWKSKGVENPRIYADIRARLNFRPMQPYVDPNVDLAAEEWSFFRESKWIIPFEPAPIKFPVRDR